MKKLLLATLLLPAQLLLAQQKEGKITYEMKVDMYRRIPAENAQMRAMVPQFRTSKFELQYADNQSVYKAKEEEQDITNDSGGGRVVIRMGGSPDDVSYKDFRTQKLTDFRDFLGTQYLISGNSNNLVWKLEEGSKSILGYTCKKATSKNSRGSEIIAWYTEEIQVPSGPDQYCGLPGMVLGIDINKGESIFTAVAIEKTANLKDIKEPTKGKKISFEEYAKMVREANANGGGMRIVTN